MRIFAKFLKFLKLLLRKGEKMTFNDMKKLLVNTFEFLAKNLDYESIHAPKDGTQNILKSLANACKSTADDLGELKDEKVFE